ncbi:AraC family transcriptional regulator [Pseudomonas sp. 5P_3.1_Bac2]|uniref:AraC family transcriptional regulator GliR n=1 Tax=Pseudomonas sp. 5P_3.1_Bac2 TaxID=2971617 RepID=UPI0021C5C32E|nr:AraC family transcriptional regulator [Pseudomonas sp. 5P_3.1_Bac2]MCU1716563.1 AraC family transcriptional regulator [Pseudomonas sp. 5P_3.1_Bac2]
MQNFGSTAVAALLKFVRHAQQLGVDPQPVLHSVGLDPEHLNQSNQRLSEEAVAQLLRQLIEQTGDPLFGLHSARYVQPGSWSVLGYITMNCATLGEAMARIVPFEKLVGDMGTSRIEASAQQVKLIWNCGHQEGELNRHLVESVLASWLLYARWITDTQLSPQAVWFSHARPSHTSQQQYQAVFDCPVLFGQDCNALLTVPTMLTLPLRQADPKLLRQFEEHALALLAGLDNDQPLPVRVKNSLRLLLKEGLPRKERVAEKFAMTVRTLQRHLQLAGTSYQQILDELRQELAEDYLLRSDLPIQAIASVLGFSETRSFHRSFKSWTGLTPGEFRNHSTQP